MPVEKPVETVDKTQYIEEYSLSISQDIGNESAGWGFIDAKEGYAGSKVFRIL